MTYQSPLAPSIEKNLENHGFDPERVDRLFTRIQADVTRDLYPGAAAALARNGMIAATAAFGLARTASQDLPAQPATSQTLWLLYSQTKPLVSSAIWLLVERGLLNFHEPVATYLAKFVRHGKDKVTLYHLLTHQAGFPNATVAANEPWVDHTLVREAVCDFRLEWEPGSKMEYHSQSAHWVLAALIESVTGSDYRRFIQENVLEPLGLSNIFLGVPDQAIERVSGSYERTTAGDHIIAADVSTANFIRAGLPGAGGYGSATDMALFYQMLLGLGSLRGTRVLAPRTVQYATRDHTGARIDEYFGTPVHRGLGVHLRGNVAGQPGMGSTASATTFGHGGLGSSYSWGDPETGVSFSYLTNSRLPQAVHNRRLEEIMNMAHATVAKI